MPVVLVLLVFFFVGVKMTMDAERGLALFDESSLRIQCLKLIGLSIGDILSNSKFQIPWKIWSSRVDGLVGAIKCIMQDSTFACTEIQTGSYLENSKQLHEREKSMSAAPSLLYSHCQFLGARPACPASLAAA